MLGHNTVSQCRQADALCSIWAVHALPFAFPSLLHFHSYLEIIFLLAVFLTWFLDRNLLSWHSLRGNEALLAHLASLQDHFQAGLEKRPDHFPTCLKTVFYKHKMSPAFPPPSSKEGGGNPLQPGSLARLHPPSTATAAARRWSGPQARYLLQVLYFLCIRLWGVPKDRPKLSAVQGKTELGPCLSHSPHVISIRTIFQYVWVKTMSSKNLSANSALTGRLTTPDWHLPRIRNWFPQYGTFF